MCADDCVLRKYSKGSPGALRPVDRAFYWYTVTSHSLFPSATLPLPKPQTKPVCASLSSWTWGPSEKVRQDWHKGKAGLCEDSGRVTFDSSGRQAGPAPPPVPGKTLSREEEAFVLLMLLNWVSNWRTGTFSWKTWGQKVLLPSPLLLLLFFKNKGVAPPTLVSIG